MANVKLKKKKGDGGYEQLYPQTQTKNVVTGTGNVDTDILQLKQRVVNLEYNKTPIVIEVQEKYSDGEYQFYEALGINAWHFQNTEANLKIVFNETNRGGNIVIDATDDMGMTMNYTILAGFYNRKFEDGEIKPGKIYDLLYHNYQFYLMDSDSSINGTVYKELLEFDKYMYSAGGSNFFKFFRYGKRATFFISYTLSGETWSDYTKLSGYTTGFKPNAEYLYSEHKIYIQTSNNTGDERLVLSGDGIVIAGIAGKQVYKVIGVIEYIAE